MEGDGLTGGQGGAGGDHLSWLIGPEEMKELRARGFHHMSFRVGEGGRDGGPGEDSIMHLMTEDDRILETVVVKGGRSTEPQSAPPAEGRVANDSDIDAGLRVTGLLLANCIHQSNNLIYVMGCPISTYTFSTTTFEATWPFLCICSLGDASLDQDLKLTCLILDPTGFVTASQDFVIYGLPSDETKTRSAIFVMNFTGSKAGEWLVKILSGDLALAQIEIQVILPAAGAD